jgi:hypothetical protein
METNPANMVIHYWHYDPEFSDSPGDPKPLQFDGQSSFTSLVSRYAGDIPAGAMRAALRQAGTLEEDRDGRLVARQRHFFSTEFDEDFVRGIAFSLGNLGSTKLHNAQLHQTPGFSREQNESCGRFERTAWTEHMSREAAALFRAWVYQEGPRFIEQADSWLGEHELPMQEWHADEPRAVGVGLYYFEEDK